MAVVRGFEAIEAIRRGQFVQMGFSPTSCFPKKKGCQCVCHCGAGVTPQDGTVHFH